MKQYDIAIKNEIVIQKKIKLIIKSRDPGIEKQIPVERDWETNPGEKTHRDRGIVSPSPMPLAVISVCKLHS